MKNAVLITVALLLCAAFTACSAAEAADTTIPGATDENPGIGGVGIVNPIKDVSGPEAFDVMGIALKAPEGSEGVAYCTISDSIAQITFTNNGSEWTLRGQKNTTWDALCGIYEDTAGIPVVKSSGEVEITLVTFLTLGRVATWQIGDVTYTLHTSKNANDAQLFLVAKNSIVQK